MQSNLEYSLYDFLNREDLVQGIVTIKTDKNLNRKLFLNKINIENDITYVYANVILRKFDISDCLNLKYFCMYNKKDFFIYNGDFVAYINKNLENILKKSNFRKTIISSEKLFEFVENRYRDICLLELEKHFNTFLKEKKYKDRYIKILKLYKKDIEDYYKNNTNLHLQICDKSVIPFEYEYFSLYKYLLNENLLTRKIKEEINKITKNNKKSILCNNTLIYDFIEYKAKSKLLNDIKNNPSSEILMYMEIKEAIKNSGKKLDIITLSNKRLKVINFIYNDGHFNCITKSMGSVKQKDIKEIVFNKKVLWKRTYLYINK